VEGWNGKVASGRRKGGGVHMRSEGGRVEGWKGILVVGRRKGGRAEEYRPEEYLPFFHPFPSGRLEGGGLRKVT